MGIIERNISTEKKYNLFISGITQKPMGIEEADSPELVLASVKMLTRRTAQESIPEEPVYRMPVGYLYVNAPGQGNKIYYSEREMNNIKEIGVFDGVTDGNIKDWQPLISEAGDIIWLKRTPTPDPGTTRSGWENPRIHVAGDYSKTIEIDFQNINTPIACSIYSGASFAFDENGKEYLMFCEYTNSKVMGNLYAWKITQPYSDPANWKIVFTRTTSQITHFHALMYDPFFKVHYLTSGDFGTSAWWWTLDRGTTWTEIGRGAAVYRSLFLAITKEYIYYATDNPGGHALYQIGRNSSGVATLEKWTKLTDLTELQATYATVLMHSPPGLLLLDTVEYPETLQTDTLSIYFWSFEDNKLHKVKEIKRQSGIGTTSFGFPCKCFTTVQGIYDLSIAAGYERHDNKLDLPFNEGKRRRTVVFHLYRG